MSVAHGTSVLCSNLVIRHCVHPPQTNERVGADWSGEKLLDEAELFFYFKKKILFTTVLSQWDFSHGKFGLLSPRKASCDRVALLNLRRMLNVLV